MTVWMTVSRVKTSVPLTGKRIVPFCPETEKVAFEASYPVKTCVRALSTAPAMK